MPSRGLASDAGCVHGQDALFSERYTVCMLEEALENDSENLRLTVRNIAVTFAIGLTLS